MARSKHQSENFVLNYLRFSRSQRRAMIIMLFSAACYLVFVHLKQQSPTPLSSETFAATETLPAIMVKQSPARSAGAPFQQVAAAKRKGNIPFEPAALSHRPAHFDPNTASFEALCALGLNPKAANNIIQYRQKGGRFKKPEDLRKMYALKPEEATLLIPFVKIETVGEMAEVAGNGNSSAELFAAVAPSKHKPIPISINVNRADSATWQLLPGIGAKRAVSILKFREKLGGFVSIEQVGETFGLPDSVFQKIKNNLEWEPGQIEQLSLNHATEAELKAHPYIGWQWAKLIVAYRNQHGPYATVDDLMKIHIMKKEWLEQVRAYLKAD